MRIRIPRLHKHTPDDPEEIRCQVIAIALAATEALRLASSLNRVDTSPFQEAHIYKPFRAALGWTEQNGWRRNPSEIAELQKRLSGLTDLEARRQMLHEIIKLRYPSTEDQAERWLKVTIHVFRWLHTHGLIHQVEQQWVLFAPSGLTAPAFEFVPSYEIPATFVGRLLNSLAAQGGWQKAFHECTYRDVE